MFVTLLQPYSDYSFEELRLFAPKVKRYVCVCEYDEADLMMYAP